MTTVRRYDATSPLEKGSPLPGGGLAFAGYVTRTGVAVYQLGDGTTRRELRPADEVFHADSLASLRFASVTNDHPPPGVEVNAANWKTYAIGTVGPNVEVAGTTHVGAPILVQDGAALEAIGAGRLKECSGGYNCELDLTPGVHEGQAYDAVQRRIRYNHVALGPPGWGRLGASVALRLDAKDGRAIDATASEARLDSTDGAVRRDTTDTTPKDNTMSLKIDSKEATQADIDRVIKERDTAAGSAEALGTELAATKMKLDAADKALAAATSPERVKALVNERVLVRRAYDAAYKARADKDVAKLDEEAMGGMDATAMMLEALKLAVPGFNAAGKSPDFIAGAFQASVLPILREATGGAAESSETAEPAANAVSTTPPTGAPAGDSILHVRGGPPIAPVIATTDASDRSPDAARARMIARNRSMAEGKRN